MARLTRCLALIVVMAAGGCGKDEAGSGGGGGEAKGELARVMARKLANEAYPQWSLRAASPGGCPATADLAEYVAQRPDFKDPWGRPYVVRCGEQLPPGVQGIAVLSSGPDGKPDTADDLRSWQ